MTTVENRDEGVQGRLLLCAQCTTPYVARTLGDGGAIPSGVDRCTRCGCEAFVWPGSNDT